MRLVYRQARQLAIAPQHLPQRSVFKCFQVQEQTAFVMDSFRSNGVEIAFADYQPTGPDKQAPILLIHGFASTHAVNWLFTQWIKTLTEDGRRVVIFDNRGHGQSEKLYDPALYSLEAMADDANALLDHLAIPRADVMGYSMGGRITAHIALDHADRVRSALIGGLFLAASAVAQEATRRTVPAPRPRTALADR